MNYKEIIAPTVITGILASATILVEKYSSLGWASAVPIALLGGLIVALQYYLSNRNKTTNVKSKKPPRILIPGSKIGA